MSLARNRKGNGNGLRVTGDDSMTGTGFEDEAGDEKMFRNKFQLISITKELARETPHQELPPVP